MTESFKPPKEVQISTRSFVATITQTGHQRILGEGWGWWVERFRTDRTGSEDEVQTIASGVAPSLQDARMLELYHLWA